MRTSWPERWRCKHHRYLMKTFCKYQHPYNFIPLLSFSSNSEVLIMVPNSNKNISEILNNILNILWTLFEHCFMAKQNEDVQHTVLTKLRLNTCSPARRQRPRHFCPLRLTIRGVDHKLKLHVICTDEWSMYTISHKEFRDEVHVPIPAFSHWLRRVSRKAEALVEL